MYDTDLPRRIRLKGVPVVLVGGWETRGSVFYEPFGAVDHDTVGSPVGAIPSLEVLIFGRTGVPGPLSQVGQSREAGVGNDKAYIIAAGRANHAGVGNWRGLTGNSTVGGVEVEHTGMFAMPAHRLETTARITAALLEAPGSSRNAAMSCQHLEWATPPGRKIDISTGFETLAKRDAFRARVAYWINRTIEDEPSEEEDMPAVSHAWDPRDGAAWEVVNFSTRRWLFDPYQVDISRLYWASKGVVVDSGTWSTQRARNSSALI